MIAGDPDTDVYCYVEDRDTPDSVSASEFRLIAVVDGVLLDQTNFTIAVESQAHQDNAHVLSQPLHSETGEEGFLCQISA